jgi:flagellar FliL protein
MSKPAPPAAEAAAAEAAPAKGASPWPALIAAIILMPAISFATAQFLLLPKLRELVTQQAVEGGHGEGAEAGHGSAEPAKSSGSSHGGGGHGKGKEGATKGEATFDFENVVVNLSGSMGTRFLKVNFTTIGSNPKLPEIMAERKKQLLDVAINVLSARTMADLETPGAKNVVRNELLANFNQALKSDLVEQIYFTDFVIQ